MEAFQPRDRKRGLYRIVLGLLNMADLTVSKTPSLGDRLFSFIRKTELKAQLLGSNVVGT